MKNSLISICIPTYQRPELLQEALESCFFQDYEPIEIVISDDSKDDRTEQLVRVLQSQGQYQLRYYHNCPPLGQAGNVNQLFELAEGERLVLLHDDDLLLPHAIRVLENCWRIDPTITAAFGRQYLIAETGKVLEKQSQELNELYHRNSKHEGVVLSAMESALVQQFPNDGYMILTEVARRTRYRDENEVGTNRWCDFDFGIRLVSNASIFYFLNQEVSKYRLTSVSVSKQGNPTYMYPLIKALNVPKSAEWAKQKALRRLAPQVVHNYAIKREKANALKVYFSSFYGFERYFKLQGVYHILLILFPKLVESISCQLNKIKKNLK